MKFETIKQLEVYFTKRDDIIMAFLFGSRSIIWVFGFSLLFYPYTSLMAAFIDVSEKHPNHEAVAYLEEKGVVEGYDDGTFQPDNKINRAEFLKIVIGAGNHKIDAENYSDCFPDVRKQWYAQYICFAKKMNFIKGYPDGVFKPEQLISFVEASKIIILVLYPIQSEDDTELWYRGYVGPLSNLAVIPFSIQSLNQQITRGEMAEMIYRLKEKRQDKRANFYDFVDNTFRDKAYLVKGQQYRLAGGKARCFGYEIPGADFTTFKVLSSSFAMDKKQAYYCGDHTGYGLSNEPIIADVKHFEILGHAYAKDSKRVFYKFDLISSADATSFQVIDDQNKYSKDKNYVYLYQDILQGADPESFRSLGQGYSKDDNYVFYLSEQIDAQASSFEIIEGSSFARDINSVYLNGTALADVDASSFTLLGKYYVKDANKVYIEKYNNNIKARFPNVSGIFAIPMADPDTFEIVNNSDDRLLYGRDRSKVYFNNILIDGADPETFSVIEKYHGFSHDKNYAYLYGEKIEGSDGSTFEVLNWSYSKDQYSVYFNKMKVDGADPKTFIAETKYDDFDGSYDAYDQNHQYKQGKVVK